MAKIKAFKTPIQVMKVMANAIWILAMAVKVMIKVIGVMVGPSRS